MVYGLTDVFDDRPVFFSQKVGPVVATSSSFLGASKVEI